MKNFIQKLNKNENKNVRVAAHGDPKGITLISLVITIVVLIILAGVAISMTLGENGIFTKAQEAKKMQTIATAKEQIGAEILSAQVEAIERNEELEQAQIEDIISKYGELQEDGDTIILNDTEYEVSLREIYNEMAEEEGDETTELAQLKALLSQTTVTEDKILKDYKAYKDGQLITGTMENYAGQTQDATVTSDDTYTYLSIPNNGYYTTGSRLRTANSNINDKTYFIKNGVIQSGYSMVNPTTGITWKYVESAGLLSCESTVASASNYTKVLGAISIDVTNFNKIVLAASSYHINHQPCITLGTTTSHVGSSATITRVLDVSGYTGEYYVKIENIYGTCGTYSYNNYAPLEVTTGESSTTGKAWFVVYDLYAM